MCRDYIILTYHNTYVSDNLRLTAKISFCLLCLDSQNVDCVNNRSKNNRTIGDSVILVQRYCQKEQFASFFMKKIDGKALIDIN